MAEAGDPNDVRGTMPQRGKVQQVCQEWLVHEDGALAYKLQDKEIQQHYGLNRFNRRTVREDIPVAKIVQSDEETRQQQERFQELQALNAQAEEDAEIAKRVAEELVGEEEARRRQRELEDEDIARLEQEKEKERYKKHVEKRKEKQLKKEREILEQQLARHTQEARLVMADSGGRDDGSVEGSIEDMHISSDHRPPNGYTRYMYRITPAGRIEDDGDFSDFFPPVSENVDFNERVQIQAQQDEELARLLQEQEHKRTKAEVDKSKLKEIEEQDARLAKIIHEQEKLKAKKIKQKRKEKEEAKRQLQLQQQQQQQILYQQQQQQQQQQQASRVTNPATRPLPDLPGQRRSSNESPIPPVQNVDHRKVRRDSFLQSIANGPSPNPQSPTSSDTNLASRNSQMSRQQSQGMVQNSQMSRQQSQEMMQNSPMSRQQSQEMMQNSQMSRQQSREMMQNQRMVSQPIPANSVGEVERWLASTNGQQQSLRYVAPPSRDRIRSEHSDFSDPMPPSPSPPGSYHSEEEMAYRSAQANRNVEACYAVSNPIPFNIAAAIDPTYKRRQHEIQQSEETESKVPVSLSRSLPVTDDMDLEWDPSLRGSLRRPKGTWNHVAAGTYDGTLSSREEAFSDDGPVVNPWQPVQGQRRSAQDRVRKPLKKTSPNSQKNSKSSCKQQ